MAGSRQGQGQGAIAYEIVSENLDGSRKVDSARATSRSPFPPSRRPASIYQRVGPASEPTISGLLRYYPEDTFSQYCLLQSAAVMGSRRRGCLCVRGAEPATLELDNDQVFTGSTAIQAALQRSALVRNGPDGRSEHSHQQSDAARAGLAAV